uniref:Uncharacterized protein n=1 Tax=Anguilla anguilla TaxID=7936 RepID=A0A0E9RFQ2_ANGAN
MYNFCTVFTFCVITLICDTNVKYLMPPFLKGPKVFFIVKED